MMKELELILIIPLSKMKTIPMAPSYMNSLKINFIYSIVYYTA